MNSDWIKVIVSTNSKINGICIYPSITISILPIRSITVKNCRNCNSCSECKVFNCPNISCKSKADVFNELLISPIAGFLVTLSADFWSSPYTHRLFARFRLRSIRERRRLLPPLPNAPRRSNPGYAADLQFQISLPNLRTGNSRAKKSGLPWWEGRRLLAPEDWN